MLLQTEPSSRYKVEVNFWGIMWMWKKARQSPIWTLEIFAFFASHWLARSLYAFILQIEVQLSFFLNFFEGAHKIFQVLLFTFFFFILHTHILRSLHPWLTDHLSNNFSLALLDGSRSIKHHNSIADTQVRYVSTCCRWCCACIRSRGMGHDRSDYYVTVKSAEKLSTMYHFRCHSSWHETRSLMCH